MGHCAAVRCILASVFFAFSAPLAASAGAMMGAGGPDAFFDQQEKKYLALEKLVDRYEQLVHSIVTNPPVAAVKPLAGTAYDRACGDSFNPMMMLSVSTAPNRYYTLAGRYQGCMALVNRNPSGCSSLRGMSYAAPNARTAQQECLSVYYWHQLLYGLVARKATAADCEMVFSAPDNPPVSDRLSPAKIKEFCAYAVTETDPVKIADRAAALASKPFTQLDRAALAGDFSSILSDSHKCREACRRYDDGCCEHMAYRKAARGGADACGFTAPYCRASFGAGAGACSMIFEELRQAYCRRPDPTLSVEPPAVTQAVATYNQASAAFNAVIAEFEGFEPKSDPRLESEFGKIRDLRKRLERVPKWGSSKAGRKK